MKPTSAAPPAAGFFITFEGIDGAGKSSHIEPLAQALRAHGRAVTLTREPGGTPLAEQLRSLLLAQAMDALTEALLLFAARREHLLTVIEPALAQGQVLLCDRFTDATFAYQGHGRGFDLQVLQTLEQWVQACPGAGVGASAPGLRQPDLTLWFDLPAATAASRLAGVRAPDKFEAEPQAFFERVAAGYAARCAQFPQRFERIDASLPLEQVWQQVRSVCQRRGLLGPA
ncbi:thymidylate kinase [Serpentinimonas raichei]|jgi:dTMP kinase|uniref:Thymidylate kinase n=1 Tax=Serpentinimonas raichei TaxID=1458425 RepID=A0A060NN00_9BURK|nr:dTMP kinase [Serpentinimonas raichei]BAO80878.1 thymidylate kinase [Serpentinimonas raichei]